MPKVKQTARISLVVWEWEREKVEKMARKRGVSINELVRSLIREAKEK